VPKEEKACLQGSQHRSKMGGKTEVKCIGAHTLTDFSRLVRWFSLTRKSHKRTIDSAFVTINEEYIILISLTFALIYKKKDVPIK
jgi:hypothetical protein